MAAEKSAPLFPQLWGRKQQALASAGLALLCLAPGLSTAQVYRIVGADGKVTFSDKPPAEPNRPGAGAAGISNTGRSASANAPTGLPFELRQIASKYPVTLYVGNDCGPCSAGRSLLTSRGIPYSEKTVSSNDDIQALQRLSGDASLPFLTIGGQQLKGFSDAEWTQYLNAAGFPPSSVLPSSYRPPAAAPLVAAKAPAAPADRSDAAVAAKPTVPAAPSIQSPSTSSGIRF